MAIEAQLVPIPEFVLSIPGRISSATYELVFLAAQLPPLGVKSYFIEKSSPSIKTTRSINIYEGNSEDITISNHVITKCLILQNLNILALILIENEFACQTLSQCEAASWIDLY